MGNFKDITDLRFGKLIAISRHSTDSDGRIRWLCKCDCGNTKVIRGHSITKTKNPTRSCGCLSKKHFVDLTGRKFNRLTLVKHLGINNNANNYYSALCDCGKSVIVEGSDARKGKIRSCGCLKGFSKRLTDTVERKLFVRYKSAARKRGYNFDINLESFSELIKKPCTYCGVTFSNTTTVNYKDSDSVVLNHNGIDRIDNSRGYELDNVATCCEVCNQAKHTMGVTEFKDWVRRVCKHIDNI